NDRRIEIVSLRTVNALVGQRQVHGFQRIGCNAVLLQQMTKIQDRRLVGDVAPSQREFGKVAYRGAVVERLFHGRIREVEPLPHEVAAQHDLQRVGPVPVARLRVVWDSTSSAKTFQGTARTISARNSSRLVTLRLPANSRWKSSTGSSGLPNW